MKEKLIIALVVVAIAAAFSSCKATGNNDDISSTPNGTNEMSSIVSDNIPNSNTDGEYDDDKDTTSNSSNLKDDVSSFVSSGKQMIDSMI